MIAFLSTIVLFFAFITSAWAEPTSEVSFDPSRNLVTVKSGGRQLGELLSDVGEKAGVAVYIEPSAGGKVFVDIKGMPVDAAIKKMIKPLNCAFVYRGGALKAVKVFSRSEADATMRLSGNHSGPSSGIIGSSAERMVKAKPVGKKELEAKRVEEARRIAAGQGRLAEFEAQEKEREKRNEKINSLREERKRERERLRARMEDVKKTRNAEGLKID